MFTSHALPLKSDDALVCQARVQLDHCEQTVRNVSSIGIGIATRGWSPEYVDTCEVEGGRKRKPTKSAPKSRQRQANAYVRAINRSRVSRWIQLIELEKGWISDLGLDFKAYRDPRRSEHNALRNTTGLEPCGLRAFLINHVSSVNSSPQSYTSHLNPSLPTLSPTPSSPKWVLIACRCSRRHD